MFIIHFKKHVIEYMYTLHIRVCWSTYYLFSVKFITFCHDMQHFFLYCNVQTIKYSVISAKCSKLMKPLLQKTSTSVSDRVRVVTYCCCYSLILFDKNFLILGANVTRYSCDALP